MPATAVNAVAWAEEKVGILPENSIRVPYIPSPDWSRDLLAHEGGTGWGDTHNWSKGLGAGGAETLAGAWLGRASKARGAMGLADDGAEAAARLGSNAPTAGITSNSTTISPQLSRGMGNIGSHGTVDAGKALSAGEKWLGKGYAEIGPKGSGVFRSSDGLRQFRMTSGDLNPLGHGANSGLGSHVHFEALDKSGRIIENLHIPVTP